MISIQLYLKEIAYILFGSEPSTVLYTRNPINNCIFCIILSHYFCQDELMGTPLVNITVIFPSKEILEVPKKYRRLALNEFEFNLARFQFFRDYIELLANDQCSNVQCVYWYIL